MKLIHYITVLILVFLLAFNAKGQTTTKVQNINITKEIIVSDTGISKIDKCISIIIHGQNKISIKEDTLYQGFTIANRKVIPSYEDNMVYDIYYGLKNGLVLEININPYSSNIMQVNISYDDGKTYYYYKLN